jgi:CrcB protein
LSNPSKGSGGYYNLNKYIAIAVGGALGSMARYWIGGYVGERFPTTFPYGTLLINISGSFVIGLFLTLITERVSVHTNWRLGIAVGFVGAYTTFSTFEFETFKLFETGSGISGFMNVIVSLLLGFVAVWGGVALGRKIDAPAITRHKLSLPSSERPPSAAKTIVSRQHADGGSSGDPTK